MYANVVLEKNYNKIRHTVVAKYQFHLTHLLGIPSHCTLLSRQHFRGDCIPCLHFWGLGSSTCVSGTVIHFHNSLYMSSTRPNQNNHRRLELKRKKMLFKIMRTKRDIEKIIDINFKTEYSSGFTFE